MRYFIMGCTGFIGRHIVRALQDRGNEIRGLSRQPPLDPENLSIDLFQGDLSTPDSLQGAAENIDIIIHAAGHAHASTGPSGIHRQVTLEGTRHLLAEAEKSGVQRFIFISSVKAMPEPGDRLSGRDGSGSAGRRIRAVTPPGRGTGPGCGTSHRHARQHPAPGPGLWPGMQGQSGQHAALDRPGSVPAGPRYRQSPVDGGCPRPGAGGSACRRKRGRCGQDLPHHRRGGLYNTADLHRDVHGVG